jgi:hypothetical protein
MEKWISTNEADKTAGTPENVPWVPAVYGCRQQCCTFYNFDS